MATRVAVAPGLLSWAVERAGWDEQTASRRAPKLEEWVSGRQPTLKQLEKFASDTHTPLGLLFLPEPPDEQVPIPDMRTIGDTGVARPSADLLDMIYLCQDRQEWYRAHALAHGFTPLDFAGSATTSNHPDLVADHIRSLLNLDVGDRAAFSKREEARRRLIERIEDLGVLVMVSGIVGASTRRVLRTEEFRGFALADPIAPLIFINGTDAKAAQIFTMIHELAHIWLGESALSDAAVNAKQGKKAELWCNRVAAEVLVPQAVLRTDYRGEPTADELDRLANRYRVSTLVVLKQLLTAHLVAWEIFTQRYDEESDRIRDILAARRTGSQGGNYYNTQPLRLSRQFARAVITSTFEGSTGYRDAYRLLGTKKHETFQGLATALKVA
ncbi:MAG: DNA-binding protein [Candidatus Lumbricidophila eiseniae]|uniref:DNA-binding protein n=1 Tax=Candidatus Lumbricidiphila eiseniae TaxID=1969409 RepID=A0A2A6FST5_9MICO|nr:MAG: DNA-binding protein [Candidatus Lumbricidophila eiseniae]